MRAKERCCRVKVSQDLVFVAVLSCLTTYSGEEVLLEESGAAGAVNWRRSRRVQSSKAKVDHLPHRPLETQNMSITTTEAPPRSQPASLLLTLKAFQRVQETRRSLSLELEGALSSFLSNSPTPLADPSDSLASLPTPSGSTCATEAVRPPNEAELSEVLRIGFVGIMETRDEVDELEAVLRLVWKREDLADVVKKIEGLEGERLKEVRLRRSSQTRKPWDADRLPTLLQTIQRDQLRRLAMLDPAEDFGEAIAAADKRCAAHRRRSPLDMRR